MQGITPNLSRLWTPCLSAMLSVEADPPGSGLEVSCSRLRTWGVGTRSKGRGGGVGTGVLPVCLEGAREGVLPWGPMDFLDTFASGEAM